jgi:hypothetical protein
MLLLQLLSLGKWDEGRNTAGTDEPSHSHRNEGLPKVKQGATNDMALSLMPVSNLGLCRSSHVTQIILSHNGFGKAIKSEKIT